jgi:hypothetical protein
MKFFSVKDRKMVDVPDSQVKAVRYERITRSGKKQVRYALMVEYNGRRLIKFVDEGTYRRFADTAQQEREPTPVCSSPPATQRQQALSDQLRAFAWEQGVEWERLSPKARAEFVLRNTAAIAKLDDFFTRYEGTIEPVLREAAAQRALDWDKMSDDERTAFVAEWLED